MSSLSWTRHCPQISRLKNLRDDHSMRMIYTLVFYTLLVISFSSGVNPNATISQANTDFAWKCYQAIAAEGGNVILSPLSLTLALTVVSYGAKEHTLSEIYTVLGYSNFTESEILETTMRMLQTLNSNGNLYEVHITNKLYGDQTLILNREFVKELRSLFDSSLEKVDFEGKSEYTRAVINAWVQGKTDDKIKEILSPGSITTTTSLYMVNGIYFASDWKYQFREGYNMVDQDFRVSFVRRMKVTYMSRYGKQGDYGYAELPELNAKILEVPYQDSEISLYLLLPNAVEGLKTLERKLKVEHFQYSNVQNVFSRLTYDYNVDVRLPKFKMTQPIHPKKILVDMGMVKAFTNAANFSGITLFNTPIKLSEIVHKAFFEVDNGLEGAVDPAATREGLILDYFSWTRNPKRFYADHPFIFFIREKTTGSILFMGRYVAPPGEGGELPRVGELNYQLNFGYVESSTQMYRTTPEPLQSGFQQWLQQFYFNQFHQQRPSNYYWSG